MNKTKKEAFSRLLEILDEQLSQRGCNDFTVENTPELYAAIEESGARNVRCKNVEEFRKHPEYGDYKPYIVNGKIYTQDFVILEILRHELGLD